MIKIAINLIPISSLKITRNCDQYSIKWIYQGNLRTKLSFLARDDLNSKLYQMISGQWKAHIKSKFKEWKLELIGTLSTKCISTLKWISTIIKHT